MNSENFAMSRLGNVQSSASAGISLKAKAMLAEGKSVIDLGLGEPDFDTPAHIIEAAHEAAKSGQTRYPPTGGTAALKAAVIDKFKRENNLEFEADEIIISNGAKQVLFGAMMTTLESHHEVLVCAPHFDSYKNIIAVIGGQSKLIQCKAEDGFCLQPEDLEAAITPNTRWLMLNSPSNPAGATYSVEELKALSKVLQKHPQVLILSDEIYEHIVFDGIDYPSFAAVCPELKDRVLTVNGVSKAYAMTGWRIGYGAGPKELISAMTIVQSQVSSGACSVAQAAAVAALTGPQDCVKEMQQAYERRRNIVVDDIADIDGLDLVTPKGAFYAYIDCSGVFGKRSSSGQAIKDDVDFVEFILSEAGIAAVPGSAYGLDGYFRISTASSDEVIAEAMRGLARAIATLS